MALTPASSRGTSVVSCVLARDAGLDIKSQADHPILWDALYNNIEDFTALTAIPAGLGLTFLFNGTSANITTTTAGVWAFTYSMSFVADATVITALDTRFGLQTAGVNASTGPNLTVAQVVALPTGLTFAPQMSTTTAATGASYTVSPTVVIARLA